MVDIERAQRAIKRKREYPAVHELVKDRLLRSAIKRDPSSLVENGRLTLSGCLVSDCPEPFPHSRVLRALDENLRELLTAGAIRQQKQLAEKLANGPQFLNTLSELALARTLITQGMPVELEKKFFSDIDADILATIGEEKHYFEVTNLALNPVAEGVHPGMVAEVGENDLVVKKIVAKYEAKFKKPFESGWREYAWVALDVAKNDGQNIEILVQALFRGNNWVAELAEHIRPKCPNLTGVVVYRSDPKKTHADVETWHRL